MVHWGRSHVVRQKIECKYRTGVFLYDWEIISWNEIDPKWNIQLSPSGLCVVRGIKLWWSGHLETQRITAQRYCCVCFTEATNDLTILQKDTLWITTKRSLSQCTETVRLEIKLKYKWHGLGLNAGWKGTEYKTVTTRQWLKFRRS